MKVVTASQMHQIDERANAQGLSTATMMESAGKSVAEEVRKRLDVVDKEVLVLVGPGNNGGDGLVASRYLQAYGAKVSLYLWNRKTHEDHNLQLAKQRGMPLVDAKGDEGLSALLSLLKGAKVVIDALLGTGSSRPISGTLKGILEAVKGRLAEEERPYLVAVDLPTGLNCDTGEVDPATLPADLTVTLAYPKMGFFLFPGADYVGELVVGDIGIPDSLAEEIKIDMATSKMVRGFLPRRPLDANKGTFGKALIVAGSVNYPGAAYLASAAATRVGAGLVSLALAENLHPILASKLSEVTFILLPHDLGAIVPEALQVLGESLRDYDALLLGPGLGRDEGTREFVHLLLGVVASGSKRQLGFVPGEKGGAGLELPPTVIDADGLNALSEASGWWEAMRAQAILTPHPGEMARLRGTSVEEIQKHRVKAALDAAQEWGRVVILKGAHSLIAAPDGRLTFSPFANPGLATAGTGDVLAGAVVGFLAQGLDAYQAAVAGVYAHGLAGELARKKVGEVGMVAGDLLPLLPEALRSLGAGK